MRLADQLTDYVNAACSGLWVHTQEPDEAEREIVRHAREQKWKVAVWDIAEPSADVSADRRNDPYCIAEQVSDTPSIGPPDVLVKLELHPNVKLRLQQPCDEVDGWDAVEHSAE